MSAMKFFFTIYSLSHFFLKKVTFLSIVAVSGLLVSQFMLLLSYFLPIKVILLLATPNMPDLLTSIFINMKREEIILLLTLCVFITYGLYTFAEKFAQSVIERIVLKIFDSKQKNLLNKKLLEFKFVDSFIKVLSTFILSIIMYIFILFFYKLIGIILIVYVLTAYFIFKALKLSAHKYYSYLTISSGFGFMIVFIFEIIDVLYIKSQEFSILIVLFVLIASKYIFNRSIYFFAKLEFLYLSSDHFYKKIEETKQ